MKIYVVVIIAFTNTHIGVRSSKHAHAMKNGMRHHTVQKVAGNMHKQSLRTSYKFFVVTYNFIEVFRFYSANGSFGCI